MSDARSEHQLTIIPADGQFFGRCTCGWCSSIFASVAELLDDYSTQPDHEEVIW